MQEYKYKYKHNNKYQQHFVDALDIVWQKFDKSIIKVKEI